MPTRALPTVYSRSLRAWQPRAHAVDCDALSCARLKALSAKSYLKKAETHSSELPAEEKRLVPQGTVLSVAKGKAPSADGYWLVTLATATS